MNQRKAEEDTLEWVRYVHECRDRLFSSGNFKDLCVAIPGLFVPNLRQLQRVVDDDTDYQKRCVAFRQAFPRWTRAQEFFKLVPEYFLSPFTSELGVTNFLADRDLSNLEIDTRLVVRLKVDPTDEMVVTMRFSSKPERCLLSLEDLAHYAVYDETLTLVSHAHTEKWGSFRDLRLPLLEHFAQELRRFRIILALTEGVELRTFFIEAFGDEILAYNELFP